LTQIIEEYRTFDVGSPHFPDDLYEYVSKPCRVKLAKLVLNHIENELSKNREVGTSKIDPRASPIYVLAQKFDPQITPKAIKFWLKRMTHPSNAHTKKLIQWALECSPNQAEQVLEEDWSNHRTCLDYILNGGRGDFQLQSESTAPKERGEVLQKMYKNIILKEDSS